MANDDVVDTITRIAKEEGINPAYALAVAERESAFNPNAGGTGTIRGLFQFTGANRRKYGLADNASVEHQTRAFSRFSTDLRGEMAKTLGRDPTDGELYLGHHMGGTRAARIASGAHAGYAPSDLFSPREMAGNPHFARARTGGELSQSIVADIDRRMAKHGGAGGPGGIDFAAFGQADEADTTSFAPSNEAGKISTRPGAIDFAAFGQSDEAPKPSPDSVQPVAVARPVPIGKASPVGAGSLLKDLDDEMTVRQNAPDPNDAAFQGTVQKLQPQPLRI